MVSRRTRIELPSKAKARGVMPAALSASSAFCKVEVSTLTVALPEDTCTAGASPKKLGKVYTVPNNKAITMTTYFQTG